MDTFQDINTDYLIANDWNVDFDIYVKRRINHKDNFVLLAKTDTSIANIKAKLDQKKFQQFYIRAEDNAKFERLLEKSMGDILDDVTLPVKEKSKIIYDCAKNVMQDVFEDPRSGENIKRTKELTGNIVNHLIDNEGAVPSLLQLSSHDYYTFTHCINVAVFALGLKMLINKNYEYLEEFALGCIMHDVGKTMISHSILTKPGRLDTSEFETIKGHPIYGQQLMKDHLSEISLDIIEHHHEKVSGKGYPYGLKDDEISDNAKIASISDVYDALTTRRPYSNARDPYKAIMLMKEEMTGHFEQEKFIQFIHFLGNTPKA